MRQLSFLWIPIVMAAVASGAHAQSHADFPNHHLHNFYITPQTYEHAVAMGYRLVPYSDKVDRNSNASFKQLGMIRNHNAHICPLRIHQRKSDGKLFVTYHRHAGVTPDGLNPVALANGIRRKVNAGPPTEMTHDDLFMLKGYGAARLDVNDLDMSNVSYDEIEKRFHTSWPLENRQFKSCNVLCNWQSRKVVQDMTQATLENIPWQRYDALFFDSLTGAARKTANAGFGDQGTYATGLAGKLAFVKAVVQFVRDPAKTGCERPYLTFTNIYDPLGKTVAKNWYASGQLRFDHYYFEKGCKEEGSYLTNHGYVLGTQRANGRVPGTNRPAYVNAEDPVAKQATAYLPADRVALDDAYTWSMRVSKQPDFDHAAFFDQHLDACGTAGIQGSWFGWYGEDYVTIRDVKGRLIYSNACQLLRALPNWDNMRNIDVPPFDHFAPTDKRSWDGEVYRSTNSYASHDIVYSRNPDNEEIYVVFCSERGTIRLHAGEKLAAAFFANSWFTKTSEDALPALDYDEQHSTVTLTALNQLDRGIRIVTNEAQ